jgi:hypothetical protein
MVLASPPSVHAPRAASDEKAATNAGVRGEMVGFT